MRFGGLGLDLEVIADVAGELARARSTGDGELLGHPPDMVGWWGEEAQAQGTLSSSATLSTIIAAVSEADPTISSKVKSPACRFLPTRRLPSKVFFIRETLNPMDPLASGSATMAPGWKTRRCLGSNASIIATIQSCACAAGTAANGLFALQGMIRAAQVWDRIEKSGLPNVKGVWSLESGIGSLFNVISIKQAYPGHSRQALFLASQVLGGAYNGRFVVVVDDDIDPTSEFDVLWAMATRCDPEQAVEIIRRSASGSLDVCIPPENKGHSSRCLIDACMPYERRHQFPPITESSEELKNEIRAKWRETILSNFFTHADYGLSRPSATPEISPVRSLAKRRNLPLHPAGKNKSVNLLGFV